MTYVNINEEYCGYKGSKDVLDFIRKFLTHNKSEVADEILKNQFANGYCYYFATILKTAFNRGEICWCSPYGHFCWVDEDGVPYDIYGICISEAEHYIPYYFLGEALNDFLHTDKEFNATNEDIQGIIDKYLLSNK